MTAELGEAPAKIEPKTTTETAPETTVATEPTVAQDMIAQLKESTMPKKKPAADKSAKPATSSLSTGKKPTTPPWRVEEARRCREPTGR